MENGRFSKEKPCFLSHPATSNPNPPRHWAERSRCHLALAWLATEQGQGLAHCEKLQDLEAMGAITVCLSAQWSLEGQWGQQGFSTHHQNHGAP